jgi:hypothetical protein
MLASPQATREYGRSGGRENVAPALASLITLFDSSLVKFSRAARVQQLVCDPVVVQDLRDSQLNANELKPSPSAVLQPGNEVSIDVESLSRQSARAQFVLPTSHGRKQIICHAPRLVDVPEE